MTTTKNKFEPTIEEDLAEEEQEAAEAEKKNSDIESLLSEDPEFYELASGRTIRIRRLKTRETLKLLKIVTHGAGGALASIDWTSLSGDNNAFVGQLVAIITMAVPNAEDETLEFIQSMVEPLELIQRARTKADRDRNAEMWEELGDDLLNPELEDTLGIITNIVRQEAGDIQGLGKRLRAMLPMVRNS